MTHTEAVTTLASERYLLDEMNTSERDAFEAHYFECDECAADVTAGARMQDGVKAGLIQAPHAVKAPARIATFAPASKGTGGTAGTAASLATVASRGNAWYRSAMLPWAVAATLAVMVGYQTQRPSGPITEGQTAEALTPVLLRPASRGAVPTVQLSGRTHVALALDVDAAGSTEVAYELRQSTGSVVTTGRGAAPAAGAPLLVVIPSFTLTAEERYILTVRDASPEARTLGEYPFATTR